MGVAKGNKEGLDIDANSKNTTCFFYTKMFLENFIKKKSSFLQKTLEKEHVFFIAEEPKEKILFKNCKYFFKKEKI